MKVKQESNSVDEMNILLTVNPEHQAMLLHDKQLTFEPLWVEFSKDKRGIRIIGEDGHEHSAGVVLDRDVLSVIDDVNDIILFWTKDGKPLQGYVVPFISQSYDHERPVGRNYKGGWHARYSEIYE